MGHGSMGLIPPPPILTTCTLHKDEILRYQGRLVLLLSKYMMVLTHPTTSNVGKDEKIGWQWILFSDLLSSGPAPVQELTDVPSRASDHSDLTWTQSKHSTLTGAKHYHSRHPYLRWRLALTTLSQATNRSRYSVTSNTIILEHKTCGQRFKIIIESQSSRDYLSLVVSTRAIQGREFFYLKGSLEFKVF